MDSSVISCIEMQSYLLNYAESKIKDLELQISKLPKGYIMSRLINGKYRYYHCIGSSRNKSQKYINADAALVIAREICERRNLESSLKNLKKYHKIFSANNIKNLENISDSIDAMSNAHLKQMRKMRLMFGREKMKIFLERCEHNRNNLKNVEVIKLHNSNDALLSLTNVTSRHGKGEIETLSGISVRSKSELIILNQLQSNNLEVHYEQGIVLNGMIYHPDFLIKHPTSGAYIVWEHCGLMNSLEYFEKWKKKMSVYFNHKIHPYQNLILTYEGDGSAFNIKQIQRIIEFHFKQ